MADTTAIDVQEAPAPPFEPLTPTGKEADDIIAEARTRWTRCSDAEDAQRKSIVLAKQFRAGDQWPAEIKLSRAGGNSIQGAPPQPARPCLVVDRLSQPVRQISNTIKQADFGFDVSSNSEDASDQTAELFKGYLRRLMADSRADAPIEWAADQAIEGGIGWFRLRADYCYQTWDGVPAEAIFDQELCLERIQNNLSVYCDPGAVKPTRSDAQFMFVTEDVDRETLQTQYGDDINFTSLDEFMDIGNTECKDWVTKDTVRIAEYWRVTYKERYFHQGTDGQIVEGSQKPPKGARQSRVMRTPVVKGYKITATQVLETWDWTGTRIPIIPILGEELNVDGQCVLRGVIQEGMDAQRMVNYTYSGAMEIFALGNKSPYIAAAGQIEQYKAIWDTANIYNYSHLPYDPIDIMGNAVPPPQRDVSEAPIQAAVMLMKTSEEAIRATTSIDDPSRDPQRHSGRAIQSLQAQSDLSTSNYPQNVQRAIIYCADQILEVLPRITRKGQTLHVLGADDATEKAILGMPYTKGQNGQPQPLPPGVTPEMMGLSQALVKFYDLNAGRYSVTATVGKSIANKREEGVAALGELIPHLPPPMAAALTPEYIEQLSMPQAHKMAELARNALPPELKPQDPNGPAPLPPEVQQQMQQMQQQMQQMDQIIKTDQVKQQGSLQETQIKAQTDVQKAKMDGDIRLEIARMDNARAIEVARIGAAKETSNQAAEAQEERLSTGLQIAHEATQNAFDRQHDLNLAAQGHQQALEQGSQSAVNAQTQQEGAQSHEQQMAQQAQEAAAEQAQNQPESE